MKQIEELRCILNRLSVNELMELTNEATAEIRHRKDNRIHNNVRILDAEIRNLLDGVGDGYTPDDHYAPARYYSTINGIKNLRIHTEIRVIIVKLLSPKGKLLPETITVRNKTYKIEFWRSKNYNPTIDY